MGEVFGEDESVYGEALGVNVSWLRRVEWERGEEEMVDAVGFRKL